MITLFGFLVLLAPLYVWRFQLVGLPTNFLMVFCGLVIVVGACQLIYQNRVQGFFARLKGLPKYFLVACGVFFLAGLVSLFVGGIDIPKIGQWLVWFVLPMGCGTLLYYYSADESLRSRFLMFLYVFVGLSGALAVLQYFFLIGLPSEFWGNSSEPKRAIAFFVHPNGYALFVAPILAFLLPDVVNRFSDVKNNFSSKYWALLLWGGGVLGLLLSLSRGGVLGLLVAAGLFSVITSKKILKSFLVVVLAAAVVVAVVPNFRYRVLLPFYGEKSSVARFSLWETGTKAILDNPILGQGLNGFNYGWQKFNTDPNLEHYNFPHNTFLNFWVDTGLLGLMSFLWILIFLVMLSCKHRRNRQAFGLLLFIVALVAHGLIDIPYFKNDLALVFWLVVAFALSSVLDKEKLKKL